MTRYTISPAQGAVIQDLIARGYTAGTRVDPAEVYPTGRNAYTLRRLGHYFDTWVWNLDTSFKGIILSEAMLQAEAGDKVDGGHRGQLAVLHKRQPDPVTAIITAARLVAYRCQTCPIRTPAEDALIVALAAYDAREGTPDA